VDASVSGGERETPAADEDHASAGAKSARTALPHPWKATVKLSLSSSMQLSGANGWGPSTGALLVPVEAVVFGERARTLAQDDLRVLIPCGTGSLQRESGYPVSAPCGS